MASYKKIQLEAGRREGAQRDRGEGNTTSLSFCPFQNRKEELALCPDCPREPWKEDEGCRGRKTSKYIVTDLQGEAAAPDGINM